MAEDKFEQAVIDMNHLYRVYNYIIAPNKTY